MDFLKWFVKSNTMILGVIEIAAGAGIAVLTGQATATVGLVMVGSGTLQIIQRAIKRYKEEKGVKEEE